MLTSLKNPPLYVIQEILSADVGQQHLQVVLVDQVHVRQVGEQIQSVPDAASEGGGVSDARA